MSRVILDAGAFIAFERGDNVVRAHLTAARRLGMDVVTTSPVVGQVWRDGRRQALMARMLAATRVGAPDEGEARRAGEMMGRARSNDVADALLVGLARHGDTVITSDRADITRLLSSAGIRATIVPV